ncbi:MAG TPA: PTS sugar transporter subunit IIA [Spirochaetota bacterium]|nr:PTS sugar transporter subunit IIA [Spirochaetota bacterium]
MELYKIFARECCELNIQTRSRDEALHVIAAAAMRSQVCAGTSAEQIYSKLAQREEQTSTGIGNNIALPHASVSGLKHFVLFIVTARNGVEFDALDKKPVNLFLVLLGPEGRPARHLQLLAAVSRVLGHSNVKKELLYARSSNALYENFLKYAEAAGKSKKAGQKMQLLFVVLYFEDMLYDIVEYFLEQGIEGATVIDSRGMGEYISNIPVFATFIGFLKQNKNESKTIMALVPKDDTPALIEGLETITGDLDKKQGATVFALDVSIAKGSMAMM